MTDSLISSIFSALDPTSIGTIAGTVGESPQATSSAMKSAIAAVLGGLVNKSESPVALRQLLDMAPSDDMNWSQAAKGMLDPRSSLIVTGKRLLSSLFGASENAVNNALSIESGLRPGVMSTLMPMVAPMVMSFLSRRVRDEGLSMSGFGALLQRETAAIRAALPTRLNDLLWPRTTTAGAAASPVLAQTVVKEKSTSFWPLLAMLALIPALLWIFNNRHRTTTMEYAPPVSGSAERSAPVSTPIKHPLPGNVVLRFDTGSSKLRPESQEELNKIASMLSADPNFHMKASGYTDDVGNADQNLQLSQHRANSVVAALVHKGISANRLMAEGYGEQNPIADNSTTEGRAENRRVDVGFTQ
jgi:OOP family OmpA-OmpF porin